MERVGKRYAAGELAGLVDGVLHGDEAAPVTGVSGLDEASGSEVSFADANRTALALESRAALILVAPGQEAEFVRRGKPCIVVANPRLAFAKMLALFAPEYPREEGVHPQATVSPTAMIGVGVSIGPHVTVEGGACIGDRVVLYPGVYVGPDASVGDGSIIHPNVVIRERVVIGRNVIINAGSVIGSDGFGFVTAGGVHHKTPQIGTVVIGDDVEIGANVTIDRATCGRTVVGKGTKTDNLVQVGHNVVIGEGCLLVAQVGIAGSATIGDRCILAGKSGVTGHLTMGEECVVMAQAIVAGNLPPRSVVSGTPARPHAEELRSKAAARRLPEALRELRELRARLADLEEVARGLATTAGPGQEGKGSATDELPK